MKRLLILILIFQTLDMITGVIYALYTKKFKSTLLKQGFFHKIFIWIAILTSYFIEYWLGIKFINYTCNIFIGYEVLSIIENLGKLDVNVDIFPDNVKKVLGNFTEVKNEKNKDSAHRHESVQSRAGRIQSAEKARRSL